MRKTDSFPTKTTLLLVSTLTVMAGATIAPSLPKMQEHFASVADSEYLVRLALTMPAFFIALGAPFVGILIDRLGRKPLLLIALILYGLAGSSGLILNNLGSILVGRALLGISVGGIMTTATTLVADYYLGTARAQFLGLQSAFMGLGGVFFLSLGGFIADFNWRYPFAIYLLALLLVPCVYLFLPEPKKITPQTLENSNNNNDRVTFPLTLVLLTYSIGIVTQIVFYAIPVQLPFYLKELFAANASQSGLAIALCTLFSALSSFFYRQIKAKLSFIAIYGIAFINIGIGYCLIGLGQIPLLIALGLIITGSGLGLLMPNMILCLSTASPEAMRGRILSGVTSSFFLGQFLSPFFSQPLSKTVGLSATYGWGGAVMIICALAAAIALKLWK
jgi:MFS family permease